MYLSVLDFFPSCVVSRRNENITGGDLQRSSEFPALVGFWMLCYFTQKDPMCFQHCRWLFFFYSISKDSYILLLFIYFSPFIFWWWEQTNLSGRPQKWHEVCIQIIDRFMYPSISETSIGFFGVLKSKSYICEDSDFMYMKATKLFS